jgi:hypothetical protein
MATQLVKNNLTRDAPFDMSYNIIYAMTDATMENVSSTGTFADPSTWGTLEAQATLNTTKYVVDIPFNKNVLLDTTFNLYTPFASISDIDYPMGCGFRLFDKDDNPIRDVAGYWTFRSGDGCCCRLVDNIFKYEGVSKARFIWYVEPVGSGIVKWGYDFYEISPQVSWVVNGNAIVWSMIIYG